MVIGGGKVAERKVASLLEAGAEVTLVSPTLTPKLGSLAKNEIIYYISREYRKGDLNGAFLCVVATNDRRLQKRVAQDAKNKGSSLIS